MEETTNQGGATGQPEFLGPPALALDYNGAGEQLWVFVAEIGGYVPVPARPLTTVDVDDLAAQGVSLDDIAVAQQPVPTPEQYAAEGDEAIVAPVLLYVAPDDGGDAPSSDNTQPAEE